MACVPSTGAGSPAKHVKVQPDSGLDRGEESADVLWWLQGTQLLAGHGLGSRERNILSLRTEIGVYGVQIATDRSRVSRCPT